MPIAAELEDNTDLSKVLQSHVFCNSADASSLGAAEHPLYIKTIIGSAIWNWTCNAQTESGPSDKPLTRFEAMYYAQREIALSPCMLLGFQLG